jgi:hypothetical protein
MSPDEELRLTHIAEAAALIADYLKGVSKEAFLNDRMRQDAVIRRIQIIGETVRHLSRELLVLVAKANGGFEKRCLIPTLGSVQMYCFLPGFERRVERDLPGAEFAGVR